MNDCVIWDKSKNAAGYGYKRVNGKTWKAHRWVYATEIGELIEGHTIDHLCNNRSCVNPSHLEQVPPGENQRRAGERRDKCRNGHPTKEYRARAKNGDTYCLECHRFAQQKYVKKVG